MEDSAWGGLWKMLILLVCVLGLVYHVSVLFFCFFFFVLVSQGWVSILVGKGVPGSMLTFSLLLFLSSACCENQQG